MGRKKKQKDTKQEVAKKVGAAVAVKKGIGGLFKLGALAAVGTAVLKILKGSRNSD